MEAYWDADPVEPEIKEKLRLLTDVIAEAMLPYGAE